MGLKWREWIEEDELNMRDDASKLKLIAIGTPTEFLETVEPMNSYHMSDPIGIQLYIEDDYKCYKNQEISPPVNFTEMGI